MKRFMIQLLVPPLVAPALLLTVSIFDRVPMRSVTMAEVLRVLMIGGVFTLPLSLVYAVVMEGVFGLTAARARSATGFIASILLGFCAGSVPAVMLSNFFVRSFRLDPHLLVIFGGAGALVGAIVAALSAWMETRPRMAGLISHCASGGVGDGDAHEPHRSQG